MIFNFFFLSLRSYCCKYLGVILLNYFFIRCLFNWQKISKKKKTKKNMDVWSADFNYRFAPDSSNSTVKLWLIFQSFQKFIHKLYFCRVWMWNFLCNYWLWLFQGKSLIDYFNPCFMFLESPSHTLVQPHNIINVIFNKNLSNQCLQTKKKKVNP